jgi:hypothetical protein
MVAGVIGFSHSAEGQAVEWVEGGINSEVPENAIRVRVDGGRPLCRGTLAEDQGQGNFWLDIGVVNPEHEGKCHTLRGKKTLRLQEKFYYLVPAETEGEVSMEGMVLEADVEVLIAEATAQLEADLQAVHDQTQGMVSEADLQVQLAEATEGMVSEAEVQAAVAEATEGMVSEADVEAQITEATVGLFSEADMQSLNRCMIYRRYPDCNTSTLNRFFHQCMAELRK